MKQRVKIVSSKEVAGFFFPVRNLYSKYVFSLAVCRFFSLINAWVKEGNYGDQKVDCPDGFLSEIGFANLLSKGEESKDCDSTVQIYIRTGLFCIEGAFLWYSSVARLQPNLPLDD